MGQHAFLSPSFAHIGYKCGAAALRSFQVKQRAELLREIAAEYYGLKKPDEILRLDKILEEDSAAADEGTAFHEVLEDALNNTKMKKIEVRQAINNHPDISNESKHDSFMFDKMCSIIKEQRRFIKQCDWHSVEKRVKVRGLPQFGTVDMVAGIYSKKTLYIRDLKCGRNPVDSEDNEQLMTYAVGVLDEVNDEGQAGWELYNKVEILIMGVRWTAKPWTIDTHKLQKFKQETMYPSFMNAYSINPVATPGEHCRYCLGKIHCGAWQDMFNKTVNERFETLDVEDLPTPELVKMWRVCKQAERLMVESLGPEIMQRFDSFDPPTDIKRISRQPTEEFVVEPKRVVNRLKSKVKTKSQLYKQTLMSPGQLKATLQLTDKDLKGMVKKKQIKPYLRY